MNGDLSLSQTLGGLRIANPDHDVNNTTPSSPATTPSAPIQNSHSFAASTESGTYQAPYQQSTLYGPGRIDVDPSGYGPSSYSAQSHSYYHPPSFPAGALANERPGDFYRPSDDRSAALPRMAQEAPQAMPRNLNRNPTSARPVSGAFYSQPNVPSASSIIPESRYQRLRAESAEANPSANSDIRRSNSRSASNTLQAGLQSRNTNDSILRQSSHSSRHQMRGAPDIATDYSSSSQSQMQSRTGSYSGERGFVVGSQDSHDRSAVGVPRQPAEQNGQSQSSSRVLKKGVKDFDFGRTLGEGSYSTVLAATDRKSNREFAIKVLDKAHIIKEKKVKYVNIERDTLNRLTDHPGIVKLYYTFQDTRSLYFVLDLASGGELLGVLKKMSSFDEECTRFYGAQILDSIEYMHQRGIIHRDLKPENVLLDDQMHVKITDFGTAKILDLSGKSQFGTISITKDPLDGSDADRAMSFVGTAEYVSPELLTDKNACKASDLWAFGCIIYQLLAGRPPFKAANEYLTFQKIVKLEYSFPDGFPPLARDLVTKLLVLDPTARPHIEFLKKHPFFNGIQWGKGLWKQKAPRLKTYNPLTQEATVDRNREVATSLAPKTQTSRPSHPPSAPSNSQSRRQPRIITELAPPTQLDIDWAPILTKANERILKLGQFTVNSSPTPHSPTSRNGLEQPVEAPSKFSRFFGGSTMKKKQRLVLITSGGRLILAPAGGDKKEAKHVVDLTDPEVSWRSHQDSKGYTLWCVYTVSIGLNFVMYRISY